MFIALKHDRKNRGKLRRVFKAWDHVVRNFAYTLPAKAKEVVAHVIFNVFENEGFQNPWAPLTPSTQKERARLGYGPEHPILVREGTYMGAFIHSDSPYYVAEETPTGENSYVLEIGTTNPLFPWHEKSTRFMPARPTTPIGDSSVSEAILEGLMDFILVLEKDLARGARDAG